MARRRRVRPEEEVEVMEEEVREERPRPKTLKRRVTEFFVALLGREAVQHLINAELEVFRAVRAMIDERIRSAEKAAERLQEIEVR